MRIFILLLHTLKYLKLEQIFYKSFYHFFKPKYKEIECSEMDSVPIINIPIPKFTCYTKGSFTFINIRDKFRDWNYTGNGTLWSYNLNYMDFLLQKDMDVETGSKWINKFIDDIPLNQMGLDAYPIALRGINWIKFILLNKVNLSPNTVRKWNNSLYSQYVLLTKKLEYHLLGNHLLEDAYSLFIAAIYFSDKFFYKKSTKLLYSQLREQILPDGAHFEQSPMYHCILLDRLLDCYNFSKNCTNFGTNSDFNKFLLDKATLMLGHLECIIYDDKTIPLLNDSAYNIAPSPTEIFNYAKELGLQWTAINLKECGYRHLKNDSLECIIDVGNFEASYQPGHSQADTFNYELRINGTPFIVDSGISTYNKTERRLYERSTIAHNTVSINGGNSSEIWSGFRIGNRAKVQIEKESNNQVSATHNGFGNNLIHNRVFKFHETYFEIKDSVSKRCNASSYIHLAPGIKVLSIKDNIITTNIAEIKISDSCLINLFKEKVSTEYNKFKYSDVIKLDFSQYLSYRISLK